MTDSGEYAMPMPKPAIDQTAMLTGIGRSPSAPNMPTMPTARNAKPVATTRRGPAVWIQCCWIQDAAVQPRVAPVSANPATQVGWSRTVWKVSET